MRENRIPLLFSVLFGLLGAALLVQALQIKAAMPEPMGPEAYPLVVSILMIGIAVYNVLADILTLRRQRASERTGASAATAPTDGSSWKTPLAVAALGVGYGIGLTFVGFFVSTFSFTLLTMLVLHHYEQRRSIWRKFAMVYIPLSAVIVLTLYVGIKALRIYIPAQTWLW